MGNTIFNHWSQVSRKEVRINERRRRELVKGSWGILPQKILKILDCLRQHFVRFEGSLIGNKTAKGKGKNVNNSGTFLNSIHLISLFLEN